MTRNGPAKGRIRVGICAWTDPALIEAGSFYPRRAMSAEARLRHYAAWFDTVEVNASYYAIPDVRHVVRWVERTPPDFVFNVKAYGLLTGHHPRPQSLPAEVRSLLPANPTFTRRGEIDASSLPPAARDASLGLFRAALTPLAEAGKLGYVLFQFAPWVRFSRLQLDEIMALPSGLPSWRLAVEFRDRSWFPDHASETLEALAAAGIAHVVVDAPATANAVPRVTAATAPTAVMRLHGRHADGWLRQLRGEGPSVREKYDYRYGEDELRALVPEIDALARETEEVFVSFNNNNRDYPVVNALAMKRLLGQPVVGPPGQRSLPLDPGAEIVGSMQRHAAIPRIELTLAPTPLLKLERLSRELGTELWVKRDDLTGLLESGNKVRKLEFLVGEALAQGADTLITCGTLQSNCCRAVSAVAARLGLRAVLALKGAPPEEYDGNLLLDRLLGAEPRYCSDAEWAHVDQVLDEIAQRVRATGGRPYVIPESGATVTGALGYLACGRELAEQVRHGAPPFDTIAIAAFSGGSQAGLLMAQQLSGLGGEIVSIPIAWDAASVREYVVDVIGRAHEQFGFEVKPPAEIQLIDGYQGSGRAGVRTEEMETVVRVARMEGIVLDPVYTAKAFYGLTDAIRRHPGAFGRRVCFIHTGGVFSIFPFRRELRPLLDRAT